VGLAAHSAALTRMVMAALAEIISGTADSIKNALRFFLFDMGSQRLGSFFTGSG
jgi:hypothetical protein